NFVAVEPDGQHLVILLKESTGIRLIRVRVTGGQEEEIKLPQNLRLALDLAPNAVAKDGRIALRLVLPDSWFWGAAIFDPRTGRVEKVPGGDQADMLSPGWDSEGRLVTAALLMRSSLWRFSPETNATR